MTRAQRAPGGAGARSHSPSVVGSKRRLRRVLFRRLQQQHEEARRRKSAAIRRKLARSAVFRRSRTVCCYVSLPDEVETWRLIELMLEHGKRVVVPRVSGTRLQLAEVRDPARDLAPGAFGVWEPRGSSRRTVALTDLDVVLVPGLAFDRAGNRLGRGRGYFDRLLARLPRSIPTIGLCFRFQLLDHLPTGPHDRPVHAVVTA